MARLSELPEALAEHLRALPLPTFDDRPFVLGPPLSERRVALISSAGLQRRGDTQWAPGEAGYRVIPGELPASELMMSHISVNYDRTGFQDDINVVFPIDRLTEMASRGEIGSVADVHYSFMGATDPEEMAPAAREIGRFLKDDGVNAVVVVPV
tara:strand:- start:545 stop:1006 length:462 start_codon:yes stop_codon:yes gene_type:complete